MFSLTAAQVGTLGKDQGMGEGMLTMLVSGSGCVQCQPVAPGHPGDGQHLLQVLRGQQTVHHSPGGGAQCPHECH